jgi:hypothetical protein
MPRRALGGDSRVVDLQSEDGQAEAQRNTIGRDMHYRMVYTVEYPEGVPNFTQGAVGLFGNITARGVEIVDALITATRASRIRPRARM